MAVAAVFIVTSVLLFYSHSIYGYKWLEHFDRVEKITHSSLCWGDKFNEFADTIIILPVFVLFFFF